jgi:hypothetical protein
LEIVPPTALPKVIGRPIRAPKLLAEIAPPSESCRKLAVSVEVPPFAMVVGLAV